MHDYCERDRMVGMFIILVSMIVIMVGVLNVLGTITRLAIVFMIMARVIIHVVGMTITLFMLLIITEISLLGASECTWCTRS